MEELNYTQRFFRVVEMLESDNPGIYDELKLDKSLKSKIKNGVQKASIEKIYNLCNKYTQVSADYIISGKGTPFLSDDNSTNLIPMYKSEAAAGFGLASFNVSDSDIEGYYKIKDFFNASFMLRVRGKSMEPLYNSGDIVAVRIVEDVRFVEWGKPYLIGTNSMGLLLKRLNPSDNEETVLAISDNKDNFPPFEIPKDDINGLAQVLGVVRIDNW